MFINWCSSRKPQRAPVLHSPLVAYTCIMPRRLLHKKKQKNGNLSRDTSLNFFKFRSEFKNNGSNKLICASDDWCERRTTNRVLISHGCIVYWLLINVNDMIMVTTSGNRIFTQLSVPFHCKIFISIIITITSESAGRHAV